MISSGVMAKTSPDFLMIRTNCVGHATSQEPRVFLVAGIAALAAVKGDGKAAHITSQGITDRGD